MAEPEGPGPSNRPAPSGEVEEIEVYNATAGGIFQRLGRGSAGSECTARRTGEFGERVSGAAGTQSAQNIKCVSGVRAIKSQSMQASQTSLGPPRPVPKRIKRIKITGQYVTM